MFSEANIRETYHLLRRYRAIYEADSLFQKTYTHGVGDRPLVDFVGRFEQIEDDFARATRRIGIEAALPHRNATNHRDYRDYYDEKAAALVGTLYQRDVDAFGYTFDA